MLRFLIYAVPLLFVLEAIFGFVVDLRGLVPRDGAVLLLGAPGVPLQVVLGAWLLEAFGLVALFLLVRPRWGEGLSAGLASGLLTGCLAWIFRGPPLALTMVLAAGQAQQPWWRLTVAWLVFYLVCGWALSMLWSRTSLARAAAGAAIASESEATQEASADSANELEADLDPIEPASSVTGLEGETPQLAHSELETSPVGVEEPLDSTEEPITGEIQTEVIDTAEVPTATSNRAIAEAAAAQSSVPETAEIPIVPHSGMPESDSGQPEDSVPERGDRANDPPLER